MNDNSDFTFTAEIFSWEANSAWHFIALPHDIADEIEDSPTLRGGFGSVKVNVVIGSSEWSTSIFPDTKRKTFVLPLKKSIREKEALTVGDRPLVQLTLVN